MRIDIVYEREIFGGGLRCSLEIVEKLYFSVTPVHLDFITLLRDFRIIAARTTTHAKLRTCYKDMQKSVPSQNQSAHQTIIEIPSLSHRR